MNNPKKRAKEIQQLIRKILLKEWDPVGIKEESECQDEYDSYNVKI